MRIGSDMLGMQNTGFVPGKTQGANEEERKKMKELLRKAAEGAEATEAVGPGIAEQRKDDQVGAANASVALQSGMATAKFLELRGIGA